MEKLEGKNIVIIEGADACGKTQLCNYLQNYVDGKCHIIHSNYNKQLPKQNHYRQHFLISRFVARQFDKKHYTGNRLVILDRNYISDIVYGMIGYGSKGSYNFKFRTLKRLLRILSKNAHVTVIYCKPTKSKFEECSDNRDELLNADENSDVSVFYDAFFSAPQTLDMLESLGVDYTTYDFVTDPEYRNVISTLEYFQQSYDGLFDEKIYHE